VRARNQPAQRRTGLWYVPLAVGGSWRSKFALSVAAVATTGLAAGCGGGKRQDADEPSGTYKVDVVKASFPSSQQLAKPALMRVTVRNADTRTIPNVVVTISSDDPKNPGSGFVTRSDQAGLADPSKAVWVVDRGPKGGDTAYVSTWALGPLPAGRSRSFVWHVTAVQPGTHGLRYRVAAGLDGKAKAQTAGGGEAAGAFKVSISDKPSQATVDPATGKVVRSGDSAG
jgi:hypothetical protein